MKTWKPKVPYDRIHEESKRLVLRPYRAGDFSRWRSSHRKRLPKQTAFDNGPLPAWKLSRNSFILMRTRHQNASSKNQYFVFGVFDRKNGAHLGSVDLWLINKDLKWANLGYQIHNHTWGKGYGPEAAATALKIAFGPLGLHRIEASCEPKNAPSQKTAKRAGLIFEGRRRKFFPEAKSPDIIVFGMNAIDYTQVENGKKKEARSLSPS